MLELQTKWMTNTLAKKSIQTNDFIQCKDGKQLFIIGYGNITSSGKNTYNYIIKDASTQITIGEGENAYLDALTKIILGSSPKSKANKESEDKENKEASLVSEFKKLKSNLSKAICSFNDFQQKYNVISLQDVVTLEEKTTKKNEELKSLRQTLDIATKQGNSMLVDAINEMIAKKEKE